MRSYSDVPSQIVGCSIALLCVATTTAKLHRYCNCSKQSLLSTHFSCPFRPCRAKYIFIFDLSKHKRECEYQHRYIETPTAFLTPPASSGTKSLSNRLDHASVSNTCRQGRYWCDAVCNRYSVRRFLYKRRKRWHLNCSGPHPERASCILEDNGRRAFEISVQDASD